MFDPFLPLMILLAIIAFLALLGAQLRTKLTSSTFAKRRGILTVLWLLFVGCLAYFAWPLLFLGPDNPKTRMFVQVPVGQTVGALNDRLSFILQKQGFNPSAASISPADNPQNTLYFLEARNALVQVWAQSLPLSADEAVACGYILPKKAKVANDQRQYLVAVNAIPFFSGRAEATFGAIRAELLRGGFAISPRRLPCQPAAQIAVPAPR